VKPIILARLRALLDAFGDRATYRVLGSGRRWALVFIRTDRRVDPADWSRKPGG
jgi:hypothetical protein